MFGSTCLLVYCDINRMKTVVHGLLIPVVALVVGTFIFTSVPELKTFLSCNHIVTVIARRSLIHCIL